MAYVLSSISGNLISAASAGYAPTNSADVSAIASAYQVVSSTATQLYAGTAYVTSVNDAPISAARAGNAANASLATSAYYDGTGRLISSLPDSATVSAIASAYAESAASGKLDSSASSSFYGIDNPSGFLTAAYTPTFGYNTANQISSIDGSALGGMDEAAVSGIASAYAESAVSGKADSSALSSYALSADVSGTVDLVSTQSANWGGSALALSAGPGVKFDKVGNTLVASTDETVLWSGDYAVSQVSSITLTESWKNFQSIKMYGMYQESTMFLPLNGEACVNEFTTESGFELPLTTNGFATWASPSAFWVNVTVPCLFTASTGMKVESARLVGRWNNTWQTVNTINGNAHVHKVIGINRTAEA